MPIKIKIKSNSPNKHTCNSQYKYLLYFLSFTFTCVVVPPLLSLVLKTVSDDAIVFCAVSV